ncbi:MAG: MerR family transcriptional regulator [Gottschalkiaceae bacterium]|nr:MAG: MerR family transcriptional regulator [Gottschalkiaceae bacterium]
MNCLSNYIGGDEMVEENRYTITDLSKSLKISEHTLRKYENDFNLKIPRNELGHRYYTDKELDLFNRIIEWKNKGLNKTTIQGLLTRNAEAIEQEEQALELVTLDKLTGREMKELLARQISDLLIEREEKLKEEFKRELQIELEKQHEIIAEKVIEQIKTENKKLADYIAATREEDSKGLWSRIFGKKK